MVKLVPHHVPPPNIALTLARHEPLWNALVDKGVVGPTGLLDLRCLPSRLREIVILRTCVANRCDYHFNLHVQTISERMGLSRREIEALRSSSLDRDQWSESEIAAVAIVDSLVLERRVSDDVFQRARDRHSDPALIEITNLVGSYTALAMLAELARPDFDLYGQKTPIRTCPDETDGSP